MIENKEILDYICKFCADVTFFHITAIPILERTVTCEIEIKGLFQLAQMIYREGMENQKSLGKICDEDDNIDYIIFHYSSIMLGVTNDLKMAGIKPFDNFSDLVG